MGTIKTNYAQFQIVSYIPKMVFSSLLVNTFLDLIVIYFYRSFHKTKQKWEWVVGVPLIMIFSNLFGILQSIAIGKLLSFFLYLFNQMLLSITRASYY